MDTHPSILTGMAAPYQELITHALQETEAITSEQLSGLTPGSFTLIDVREPEELAQGMIPSGLHIPRGILEWAVPTQVMDQNQPVVVYCAAGPRSILAAARLKQLGYSQTFFLSEGFTGWKARGLPWEVPSSFAPRAADRYARHLALPEVGVAGQQRLLESRVLVVGAGGLGSPAALYLAAAGVGTIGIVDYDQVDITNLQRQILHTTAGVGLKKVESAQLAMASLNPDINIGKHDLRLSAENVSSIMTGYDLVIDGSDNFPTRYLLNDASVRHRIPVIHGAVHRFEGQVSFFDPTSGPCYRCLFPLPPPPELAPNCAEAGVLGVLPGVIGALQTAEALKGLLGIGTNLVGKLLTFDALTQEFHLLNFDKNPDCPACADPDNPPPLVDYDLSCAPPTQA